MKTPHIDVLCELESLTVHLGALRVPALMIKIWKKEASKLARWDLN